MPAAPDSRGILPCSIAAACGGALWLAVCAATGRKEAWDSDLYWSIGYPGAILFCAGLAYFFPQRPWRWPLALFFAQFAAMALKSGELGGLWPFGLVLFGALSLPAMLAAKVAARFSRRAPPPEQAP